jgi:hypothetical protein
VPSPNCDCNDNRRNAHLAHLAQSDLLDRAAGIKNPNSRLARLAAACYIGPSSAAERYQREHGHKPQVKRFWRFILVSQNVTAKDHTLSLDQPMIYHMALEKAQEAAGLRKSIRIIVRAGKQFRWCRRASCRAALH